MHTSSSDDRFPRRQYITAALRDRDRYDVPLALEEAGKLGVFITDLFFGDSRLQQEMARMLGLAHRSCAGIPAKKVEWSWRSIYDQCVRTKMGSGEKHLVRVAAGIEKLISERAGQLALKTGYDLLLYSGFALEAFQRVSGTDTKRFVFVYHPLGIFTRSILEEDFARFGQMKATYERHLAEIAMSEGDRYKEEAQLAEGAFCASSFTRRSIQAAGISDERIAVVPYGAETSARAAKNNVVRGKVRFLFVGQACQRKGLHHLLNVWKSDQFAAWSELVLVVHAVDPELSEYTSMTGITVMSGLARKDLDELYENSDVFVLPSLVEGFGLVYQEALAHGCRVIGTFNTGLPDLELPNEICAIVPPGDREALSHAMEKLGRECRSDGMDRDQISGFASTRKRSVFRHELTASLAKFEETTTNRMAHPL